MRQLPKLQVVLFLPLLFLFCFTATAAIDFKKESVEIVKEKAGEEGKLVFVNFTAKWCAPCKFMDKYTYTDQRLSEYVNENYYAMKLDINSIDGFDLKKRHEVKTLPAIIVFNSQGKMVGKYEGSMSASRLQFTLEDHDIPANRIKVAKKVEPKPEPKPESKVEVIPEVKPEPPVVKKEEPIIPQEKEVVLTAKGETTLTNKFTVQVGAFEIYENVYNESERLRHQLSKITRIHPATHSSDRFNRLYVGDFETYEAAQQFRYQLEQGGLEAIVRQLRY